MNTPRTPNAKAHLLILIAALSHLGAAFNLTTIPLNTPNTEIFTAQGNSDPQPELFILSGTTLTLLTAPGKDTTNTFHLNPATNAIDIADTNQDGIPELYTIVGNSIQRQTLTKSQRNAEPEQLFTQPSLLSNSDFGPRPYVFITTWQGQPALALPLPEGLGLYALSGQLIKITKPTDNHTNTQTLQITPIDPPQAAPPNALEFRIQSTFHPPPNLLPKPDNPIPTRLARRGTYLQAAEATKLPPEDWPWYALAPQYDPDQRVMYALTDSKSAETLIVLRRKETRDLPGERKAFYLSPKRRYPGKLVIPPTTAPDFNGDGFADLLLWNSPKPGNSIDAFMRAAQRRTWPIHLTVHLYSRLHRLYEGRPTTRIQLQAPLAWSIFPPNGLPLKHLVLNDINGDGYTDVSLATDNTHFATWLFRPPNKFPKEPDFTIKLPEAIQSIELVADMGENWGTVIAIQGKNTMYLLNTPR